MYLFHSNTNIISVWCMTTVHGYPVSLLALCEHDDDLDSKLPHHAPEVLHRPGQRTLGRDVLPLFVETLTKHGINCYTV